jgi:prophage regulatory protein
MSEVALNSQIPPSGTRRESPNPSGSLADRNLEGNASGPSEPKQSVVADNFPSREDASYLIGLDDKPGAALLAASVRDVLIRIDNVCGITGLSVPTIYRLMSKGTFPRPVKITTSARAWKLSEVTAWVDSRQRGGAL